MTYFCCAFKQDFIESVQLFRTKFIFFSKSPDFLWIILFSYHYIIFKLLHIALLFYWFFRRYTTTLVISFWQITNDVTIFTAPHEPFSKYLYVTYNHYLQEFPYPLSSCPYCPEISISDYFRNNYPNYSQESCFQSCFKI